MTPDTTVPRRPGRAGRRPLLLLLGAVVVLLGLAVAAVAVVAARGTDDAPPQSGPVVRPGPTGEAFYRAPDDAGDRRPGSVVWARRLPTPTSMVGLTLLYWSRTVQGLPVAVSGQAYFPRDMPRGGSPRVVAWAHGTTGLGDGCAPTRAPEAISSPDSELVAQVLRSGAIFVATDYQGLGTPGEHPYLVSVSAGQNVLDSVRAVARVMGAQRPRAVVLGTSQGGAAALLAAETAPTYAPDVELRGAIASAPPSGLGALVPILRQSPYAGYLVMAVAGLSTGYPDLAPVTARLTTAGRSAVSSVRQWCTDRALRSFPPRSVEALGLDRVLADPAVQARLAQNDPGRTAPRAPLLIVHGMRDDTIPVVASRRLVRRYCDLGGQVSTEFVPGAGHVDAIVAARSRIDAFMSARLSDSPAPVGSVC